MQHLQQLSPAVSVISADEMHFKAFAGTGKVARSLTKKISRTFTMKKIRTTGTDSRSTSSSSSKSINSSSDSESSSIPSPPTTPRIASGMNYFDTASVTPRSTDSVASASTQVTPRAGKARAAIVNRDSVYSIAEFGHGYDAGHYTVDLEAMYIAEEDEIATITEQGLQKYSAQDYLSLL